MDYKHFCFVFGVTIVSLLSIDSSVAQGNINYNPNIHQNQHNQGGLTGSAANLLSPFIDALKNFLANNGSILNKTMDTNATSSKGIAERFNDFAIAIQSAFASPQVQQALQTGETVADTFLQDYLKGYGVSEACYEDLKVMGQGIVEWTDWAQRSKYRLRSGGERIFELRHEKTYRRGCQPGPTQTGLYSHRRWLEL